MNKHKKTLSHFATVHEYMAYVKGFDEKIEKLSEAIFLLREVEKESRNIWPEGYNEEFCKCIIKVEKYLEAIDNKEKE